MEETVALKYFGVDWVAMTLTFGAIYLLGNKSRSGFVLMMSRNSCWVVNRCSYWEHRDDYR